MREIYELHTNKSLITGILWAIKLNSVKINAKERRKSSKAIAVVCMFIYTKAKIEKPFPYNTQSIHLANALFFAVLKFYKVTNRIRSTKLLQYLRIKLAGHDVRVIYNLAFSFSFFCFNGYEWNVHYI